MSLRGLCSPFPTLLVGTAWATTLFAAGVPEPAQFRAAFEAQFPKSPPSGAALALEDLAAKLGLSLAPRERLEDGTYGRRAREEGRAEPTREDAEDQQKRGSLVSGYLFAEAAASRERVGDPPGDLVRYLEEHASELDAVRSLLLGDSEVSWETDVSQGFRAPYPNLLQVLRLERLLLARALIGVRSGASQQALETVEASWRLNEALGSRPELISQLVSVSGARQHAGVLRKIDAPAFGWPERLRNGSVLDGMLATFENQIWQIGAVFIDEDQVSTSARIYRRIGEDLRGRSRCDWTASALETVAREAVEAEGKDPEDPTYSIAMPNLMNSLVRAARFEIEAEVTALVIEARIEREALRRRHWPDRLTTLGTGVCSEQAWSYRVLRNGTVRIAFEGVPPEDSAPNRPALEFFAGKGDSSARRPPSRRRLQRPPPEHTTPVRPTAR